MKQANVKYLDQSRDCSVGPLCTGLVVTQEETRYVLDSGVVARSASSLGIVPETGDLIAYLASEHGNFIVHILRARKRKRTSITYPFAETISMLGANIELNASKTIKVRALRDLSLETGKNLCMDCGNLFQNAIGSVISTMSNWVHQCDQGSVQATDILRSDAGTQIMTADEDLRLDAKRINMG